MQCLEIVNIKDWRNIVNKTELLQLYRKNYSDMLVWIDENYLDEKGLHFPFYLPYVRRTIFIAKEYYKNKSNGTNSDEEMTSKGLLDIVPDERLLKGSVVDTINIYKSVRSKNNSTSYERISFDVNARYGLVHLDSEHYPDFVSNDFGYYSIEMPVEDLYESVRRLDEFRDWDIRNLEIAANYHRLNLELRNKIFRLIIIRLLADSPSIEVGKERASLFIRDMNNEFDANFKEGIDSIIRKASKTTQRPICRALKPSWLIGKRQKSGLKELKKYDKIKNDRYW